MLIKKIFPFYLLLFLIGAFNYCKASVETDYQTANKHYSEQKYSEAIASYEAILASNNISADVYYNLGNAYFKTNQLPAAILNYERALKLTPDHEDALFNLKLANSKTIDKVDRLPAMFIGNAWQNLVTSKTVTTWSSLCILFIFISLLLFISYLLIHIVFLKKIGFYGGCIFLVISLFTWFLAAQHASILEHNTEAIIFSSVVTVVSEPNENANKLFNLHEGLKVNLIESSNSWSKIKIPNGNVGWIKNESLQKI